VYVQPAHRQKRIGRALIESLLRKVREDSSIEQVLISVTTRQEPARRLYRSFGFQPFGIEPRALKIGSEYVDEEHLVLLLR
jgi:ribosomal protein S18 acetylase RimI-like enzyme